MRHSQFLCQKNSCGFIYPLKVADEIQNKGKHVWKRNNMDRKKLSSYKNNRKYINNKNFYFNTICYIYKHFVLHFSPRKIPIFLRLKTILSLLGWFVYTVKGK